MGRIHSIESMGLLDGPGIRTVVFFQGCSLRCVFCHNPDTWSFQQGTELSAQDLIEKIKRFKPYFTQGGGVTFSGGEPLQQPAFLLELLRLCKQEGIHTCLDTAGVGKGAYDEILPLVDLVLLDIKHHTQPGFQAVTGCAMAPLSQFLKALKRHQNKLWIRHVVVPGLTDGEEHLTALSDFVRRIPNVEKVELLPYHCLGAHKYRYLGLPYPLEGLGPMDSGIVDRYQTQIFQFSL